MSSNEVMISKNGWGIIEKIWLWLWSSKNVWNVLPNCMSALSSMSAYG